MKYCVGIIVPIHNTAKYLDECINSIIKQTFTNFKIVLVEDGSTDDSLLICKKYSSIDDRIKYIHLYGVGVSAARNEGLRYILSDPQITHVSFIDSDDCVTEDFLEKLLNTYIEKSADIVMCAFDRFEIKIPATEDVETLVEEFDNNSFWLNNFYGGCESVLWNKLYDAKIMKNINFPNGKIHEDEFVLHYIIENANKICAIKAILYHYRKRVGSIMSTSDSQKSCDDFIDAFINRIVFFHNCHKLPEIKFSTFTNVLNYIHKHSNKAIKEKKVIIKKLYIKDKKYFTFKQKLIITIKFSRKLSYFLWKN